MLTTAEVAERLNVSREMVIRLVDAGELVAVDVSIPSRRPGARRKRNLRFEPADVAAYLRAGVAKPRLAGAVRERRSKVIEPYPDGYEPIDFS
jgi:excisionase family DNA binding protein